MPKDSSGKFHLNSQRAHAADKAAGASKTALPEDSAAPAEALPPETPQPVTCPECGAQFVPEETPEMESAEHAMATGEIPDVY